MPKCDSKIEIKQGYLMFQDNKQLRVRIIDDKKAFLTFKTFHNSKVRTEYEYEIPVLEAIEMFETAICRLHKTRYKKTFQGNNVDIDVYPDGLSVVEIEYEQELLSIPDYCGEEITGLSQYSNVSIAYQQSS